MELFWVTESALPHDVGNHTFCTGHMAWIFGALTFTAAACSLYRRLNQRRRRHFLIVFAALTAASEAVKDCFLTSRGAFTAACLPLHLCGLSIFVCLADSIHPTKTTGELLYCLVLPGAVSALLFPDWLRYPFFSFLSIQSFAMHAMLAAYPMLKLTSGGLRPNFRRLHRCFILLLCTAVPVYFFNRLFGTNFFFLNFPSRDSPLELVSVLFGSAYLLGFAALLLTVWALMYIPWAIAEKLSTRR